VEKEGEGEKKGDIEGERDRRSIQE